MIAPIFELELLLLPFPCWVEGWGTSVVNVLVNAGSTLITVAKVCVTEPFGSVVSTEVVNVLVGVVTNVDVTVEEEVSVSEVVEEVETGVEVGGVDVSHDVEKIV